MKVRVWICPECSTPLGESGSVGFVRYESLRLIGSQDGGKDQRLAVACKECDAKLVLRFRVDES